MSGRAGVGGRGSPWGPTHLWCSAGRGPSAPMSDRGDSAPHREASGPSPVIHLSVQEVTGRAVLKNPEFVFVKG